MRHTAKLEHAIGQFFDVPVTYNPLIAKALNSTKAAILLDFMTNFEGTGCLTLSCSNIASETGLGLTEVKSALLILESAKVITITKNRMKTQSYTVNPFFMNDLLARLQQHEHIEGHLTFDLHNPIAINRLHIQTLKSLGAGANASILLSFLLGHLSEKDHVEHPDLSDWFESSDSVWLGMTGMTPKELRNAKRSLIELGFVERKCMGIPARSYLRLNMKQLADSTWKFAEQQPLTLHEIEPTVRAYA